jgi:ATP-dependent Clp protease ATP-binding subunit ClpA
MHDKFTDRAQKVLKLAAMEAEHYQHGSISTEHILLALVSEGSGVGANVLKNLDVDLSVIRGMVAEKMVRGPMESLSSLSGHVPQTPRAKRAVEAAVAESQSLRHKFVGTEHLLLGLLHQEDTVAARVLSDVGVRLNEAREEVLLLLGDSLKFGFEQTPCEKTDLKGPEPTAVLSRAIPHLPQCARAIVAEFDRQINTLHQEKEAAVGAQDWEQAANLRNLEYMLRARREEFISRWPKSAP